MNIQISLNRPVFATPYPTLMAGPNKTHCELTIYYEERERMALVKGEGSDLDLVKDDLLLSKAMLRMLLLTCKSGADVAMATTDGTDAIVSLVGRVEERRYY